MRLRGLLPATPLESEQHQSRRFCWLSRLLSHAHGRLRTTWMGGPSSEPTIQVVPGTDVDSSRAASWPSGGRLRAGVRVDAPTLVRHQRWAGGGDLVQLVFP